MSEYPPLPVRRVKTDNGSHVEPSLDQSWDDLTKLRWHAGVVEADSGVRAYLSPGALQERGLFGKWRTRWDRFSIRIGHSSHSSFNLDEAWDFLNGVEAGAEAVRREVAA